MSKSPLSMPCSGRLTSSHGDQWQSSPQWGEGKAEAVPGVEAWAMLGVCAVLSEGLGRVPGGSVELTPEGGRARTGIRAGAPHGPRGHPAPPLCWHQLPGHSTASVCPDGSVGGRAPSPGSVGLTAQSQEVSPACVRKPASWSLRPEFQGLATLWASSNKALRCPWKSEDSEGPRGQQVWAGVL